MRLKKIDAKIDIEKKLPVNPKKLGEKLKEKGQETKVEIIEKLVGNPGKDPVKSPEVTGKRLEETKKPHEKPLIKVAAAPPAPWSDPRQGPYLLVQ